MLILFVFTKFLVLLGVAACQIDPLVTARAYGHELWAVTDRMRSQTGLRVVSSARWLGAATERVGAPTSGALFIQKRPFEMESFLPSIQRVLDMSGWYEPPRWGCCRKPNPLLMN